MATSILRPYLAHFAVPTSVHLEALIVAQVRAFQPDVTFADLPIRLAAAAARANVNPKPIFTDRVSEGRLTFDAAAGQFQIWLNRHADARRPRWYDEELNPNALDIKGRLRFTYAHELAHRFFFLEHGLIWERLLDRVTNRDDAQAYEALYDAEEVLCDRIAARLLIPDKIVREIGTHLTGLIDTHEVGLEVMRLAERCAVTRESFLVRIARAIGLRELPWPEDAICLLIGHSTRSGSRARAQRKLRIKVMLTARNSLGHVYPGMPVQKLSAALAAYVCEALTDTRAISRIDTILLPGSPDLVLQGWSHRYAALAGEQLLLWGRLHADNAARTQDIKRRQLSLASEDECLTSDGCVRELVHPV